VAVARTVLENVMPQPAMSAAPVADNTPVDRRPRLIAQLKDLFEDVAGFDMADAEADANFMELGLDSLMLTQVALQLEKAFGVKVSFQAADGRMREPGPARRHDRRTAAAGSRCAGAGSDAAIANRPPLPRRLRRKACR
jgi:acyl carrier protein